MDRTSIPKPIRMAAHPITWRVRRPSLIKAARSLVKHAPQRLPTRHEAAYLAAKWSQGTATASPEVLVEVAELCRRADGPVLECGSGASTLVAAAYSQYGCWSLENHSGWMDRVNECLRLSGLPSRVVYAPLISYCDFDWYRVPDGLPESFDAVICDGPAGDTRGGRLGLLSVLGEKLAGARVLLDDFHRLGEQHVVEEWTQQGAIVLRPADRAVLLRFPPEARGDGS